MSAGIIAKRLQLIRKNKRMSRAKLAEKINVSNQVLTNWELGRTKIDADYLMDLAGALGVNVNFLVGTKKGNELSDDLLLELDPDNIIERYYNLPDRSRKLVDKVIKHEQLYADKESEQDFLIAAHGSEGMDDDELEIVKQDAQHLKDLFDNDKV